MKSTPEIKWDEKPIFIPWSQNQEDRYVWVRGCIGNNVVAYLSYDRCFAHDTQSKCYWTASVLNCRYGPKVCPGPSTFEMAKLQAEQIWEEWWKNLLTDFI